MYCMYEDLRAQCDRVNPPLRPPLPKEMDRGTSFSDDMPLANESMSIAASLLGVWCATCVSVSSALVSFLLTPLLRGSSLLAPSAACPSPASSAAALAFAAECLSSLDCLLRCPPTSHKRDCLPSMPYLVTSKKKFRGYVCLSIRWRRRLDGSLHLRSQSSTKHEYLLARLSACVA